MVRVVTLSEEMVFQIQLPLKLSIVEFNHAVMELSGGRMLGKLVWGWGSNGRQMDLVIITIH